MRCSSSPISTLFSRQGRSTALSVSIRILCALLVGCEQFAWNLGICIFKVPWVLYGHESIPRLPTTCEL